MKKHVDAYLSASPERGEAAAAHLDTLRGLLAEAQEAAQARRDRREKALVTYRCGRGCLLLEVWQTPRGALWAAPPARRSEGRAAASRGRAPLWAAPTHAAQGVAQKLGRRAGWLGESPVPILCDHGNGEDYAIPAAELVEALREAKATGRAVVRRLV